MLMPRAEVGLKRFQQHVLIIMFLMRAAPGQSLSWRCNNEVINVYLAVIYIALLIAVYLLAVLLL